MLKKTMIKTSIPVIYLKEGEAFICYSPAFDLTAHGDSFEDAEQSFAQTLKLFIEHVSKQGTWDDVLREYGWEKIRHDEWNPPRIIGQESKEITIPVPA
jgi:predicted RNase H-like HicB family nuclease